MSLSELILVFSGMILLVNTCQFYQKKRNSAVTIKRQIQLVTVENRILYIILLVFAVKALLLVLFDYSANLSSVPYVLTFRWSLELAIWPLLYFYFGATAAKAIKRFSFSPVHFLVPLLVIIPVFLTMTKVKEDVYPLMKPDIFKQPPRIMTTLPFRKDKFWHLPPLNRMGKNGFKPWRVTRPDMFDPLRRRPSPASRYQTALYLVDLTLLTHWGVPPVLQTTFSGFMPAWLKGFASGSSKLIWIFILNLLAIFYGWTYLVAIIRKVYLFSSKTGLRTLSTEKRDLLWQCVFVTFLSVMLFLVTLFLFVSYFSGRLFVTVGFLKGNPLLLSFPVIIGAYLVVSGRPSKKLNKYGKNKLEPEILDSYYSRLLEYVEKTEVFKDESLTLNRLAAALDIKSNDLSQVINKKQECNFKDFINVYRVEHVKVELLKPENQYKNILAIAHDSGFSSKSGFNQIFKKHTKMTPSEYIKIRDIYTISTQHKNYIPDLYHSAG